MSDASSSFDRNPIGRARELPQAQLSDLAETGEL
jgi:hypothetical protein